MTATEILFKGSWNMWIKKNLSFVMFIGMSYILGRFWTFIHPYRTPPPKTFMVRSINNIYCSQLICLSVPVPLELYVCLWIYSDSCICNGTRLCVCVCVRVHLCVLDFEALQKVISNSSCYSLVAAAAPFSFFGVSVWRYWRLSSQHISISVWWKVTLVTVL